LIFRVQHPIDFPGTTVELFGGELNTFGGGVRHATKVSDKFGFKINAQYRRGNEFTLDPVEDADRIATFATTISQPQITPEGYVVDVLGTPEVLLELDDLDPDGDGNPMTNEWFNTAVNATLEMRPTDDVGVTVSGGYNEASAPFSITNKAKDLLKPQNFGDKHVLKLVVCLHSFLR